MAKLTKDYKEYLYERLQDPDAVAGYLNAVLEEDDPSAFLLALRYVAEARSVAKVAAAADLNRESLYRMLSDQGNPRLTSMLAVLEAVGVKIQVQPLSREAIAQKARDEVRPILAAVSTENYIPELEDEYETAHTRDREPAAA